MLQLLRARIACACGDRCHSATPRQASARSDAGLRRVAFKERQGAATSGVGDGP